MRQTLSFEFATVFDSIAWTLPDDSEPLRKDLLTQKLLFTRY